MVNYSININNRNNYLSFQIVKHKKRIGHMPMEIQVLTDYCHPNRPFLDKWISIGNTDINKHRKHEQIHFN